MVYFDITAQTPFWAYSTSFLFKYNSPLLRRKDSSWSSALVQMWLVLECVCSVSHHKVGILLRWPELVHAALENFVKIYI